MSDDNKYDDKVTLIPVKFKQPVDEERYLELAQWPKKCRHGPFEIDDELDTVECKRCGEKLNAMWVLKHLASEETKWHHARERYRDEMKRLSERNRTQCEYCGRMTRISRR